MTYDRLATRGWKARSDISESRLMTRSPSLNRLKFETSLRALSADGEGPNRKWIRPPRPALVGDRAVPPPKVRLPNPTVAVSHGRQVRQGSATS